MAKKKKRKENKTTTNVSKRITSPAAMLPYKNMTKGARECYNLRRARAFHFVSFFGLQFIKYVEKDRHSCDISRKE